MPERKQSASGAVLERRPFPGHDPTLAERLEFVRDSLIAASLAAARSRFESGNGPGAAVAAEPVLRRELNRSRRELAEIIGSLPAQPGGRDLLSEVRLLLETLDRVAAEAHPRSAA